MRRWKVGALAGGFALLAVACAVPYDYDADGHTDIVWQNSNGSWFRNGDPNPIFTHVGGSPRDLDVPGDYDGDHTWEPAIVTTDGVWVTGGGRGTFTFAPPPNATVPPGVQPAPEIIPVPADYDGDGRTDAAWYREFDATWWIENQPPIQFGVPWNTSGGRVSWDVPTPADFDGDEKADLATYDPDAAHFTIRGRVDAIPVGFPDGFPAVADYDGDGKADAAVLHLAGVSPADFPSHFPRDLHAGFFIAGQDPIPLDATAATFQTPLYPVSADYVAPAGDEAAVVGSTTQGPSAIWVHGQSPVTLGGPPIVPASSQQTNVRLTFSFRCTYHVNGACPTP